MEWSQHEPSPGNFIFSGELDIAHFVKLAQDEDLLVLLRPGPYICAERDMVRKSFNYIFIHIKPLRRENRKVGILRK